MKRAFPLRQAAIWLRYFVALKRRRPAGIYVYQSIDRAGDQDLAVEILFPAGGDRTGGDHAVEPAAAAQWCARQTLPKLSALGLDAAGQTIWRVGHGSTSTTASTDSTEAPWFMALGGLPEVYPAFVESAAMVAAAEEIDAVMLSERLEPMALQSPADLLKRPGRSRALFSRRAYAYDAASDQVRPNQPDQLIKLIESADLANRPRQASTYHRFRRGPYFSSRPLPPSLSVGIHSSTDLRAIARPVVKPRVLVTAPFLARGGAEQTLFETLKVLRRDFEFIIVTLAPHREELGDRRQDFHQISERIYCLGDLLHPAAMPGLLTALIDALGIDMLYNVSGTTLFYEFGPRLKAARPNLRIVDHLYDHRIGYIDRYEDPALVDWLDACVAENRRIAEALIEEYGWTAERVPVIRPCGRPRDAFPSDPEAAREELRRELNIASGTLVILTAARMHAQKRPLDLVALAGRVRDLNILFLVVGGGDLEAEVDVAIEASAQAPVRRLPFRTDIPRLIAAADVGCLVSDYEGLPVFMIECLQSGKPFLGTGVGEMGAVLRDSGAGLVIEKPGDLAALEAAVRELYDPASRAQLAERATTTAKQFDIETCAVRYGQAFVGQNEQPLT